MPLSGLGMWEMILIFLVVLLVFGAKRLPEIGTSLGKGIREFKSSIREIETEIKTQVDEPVRREPLDQQGGEPRRLTTSSEPQ